MPAGRDVAKLQGVSNSPRHLCWLIAGSVALGCSLNPQPDLPVAGSVGGVGNGAGGTSAVPSGGTSSAGTGPILGVGGASAGTSSSAAAGADAGAGEAGYGQGGQGEGGESSAGGDGALSAGGAP